MRGAESWMAGVMEIERPTQGECAKEINSLLSISIDVKRMIKKKKRSQLLTKQNTIVTTAIRLNVMMAHTHARTLQHRQQLRRDIFNTSAHDLQCYVYNANTNITCSTNISFRFQRCVLIHYMYTDKFLDLCDY